MVASLPTRRRGGGNHTSSRTVAIKPPSVHPSDQYQRSCQTCQRVFTTAITTQRRCSFACADGGRDAT